MPTPCPLINERDDEATAGALVRCALDLLDELSELLDGLSPEEIARTAARAHLDRRGEAHAVYWKLLVARYRVLATSFAASRSRFAELARAHAEGRTP